MSHTYSHFLISRNCDYDQQRNPRKERTWNCAKQTNCGSVGLFLCGWSFKTLNTKYGLKVSFLLLILAPHHPLIGFASFLRQLSSPLERFLVAGSSVLGPFKCGTRHQSFGPRRHQHIAIFVIIKNIYLTYCHLRRLHHYHCQCHQYQHCLQHHETLSLYK